VQVHCLSEGLKVDGVLHETGDRERPGDRAEADTSSSYAVSRTSPVVGSIIAVRRSASTPVTRPTVTLVRRSTRRNGTTPCRGSSAPEATSGSSGW